jgi:cyclophilin family peptidyl-prolyl cis-trans isomerase
MRAWKLLGLSAATLAFLQATPVWSQEPLKPLPFIDKSAVPTITQKTTVRFTTDAGEFMLEVYPQAAPNAAARFLELVKSGFFDNTPLFRVVPKFVVQFGINWRGEFPKYKSKNFNDDPSLFALEAGTIAFAKSGKNTNSSQVFINYGNNSRLAIQGDFTAFGKVVSGNAVLEKFRRVGDPSMGLDQDKLWLEGEKYLKSLPPEQKPNTIIKAEIVP